MNLVALHLKSLETLKVVRQEASPPGKERRALLPDISPDQQRRLDPIEPWWWFWRRFAIAAEPQPNVRCESLLR